MIATPEILLQAPDYAGPDGGRAQRRDRATLEQLVRLQGDQLADETWPPLLAWFAAHHPNPKLFFLQPAVLAQVPAAVDLTALPCPARPSLAAQPLFGGRTP